MMEAKPIPGPWVVLDHNGVFVTTVGGLTIAEVTYQLEYAGQTGRVRLKNAALIAAAPDLLEAAQAAWNCIAELPPTQARVEVAQMLQAAIEKATGAEA